MTDALHDLVFDSFAVLAYLFGEPGADPVAQILVEVAGKGKTISISSVNWDEILYRAEQQHGSAEIASAKVFERRMPVEILPATKELAELAVRYKASHKISLADAFTAALAKTKTLAVVTGDPEFKSLESEIRILWLPQRIAKAKRK